jgi:hypothetical protein
MQPAHVSKPSRDYAIWGLCILLGIAGAVGRIVPVMDNFAPIGALALFAGAMLIRFRYAWLVPVFALLFGDVLVSLVKGYPLWTQSAGFALQRIFDLAAFVLITWVGYRYLSRTRTALRVGTFALASSFIFFLLSNFGVWFICQLQPEAGLSYPPTLGGLIDCYILGLPFYRGTLLGDLFYSGIFFGLAALASRQARALSTSHD